MKLRKEYDFYLREKDRILSDYAGRYVVIVGEKLIGDYATQIEAINATVKTHALGSFLVKLVKANEEPVYIPRMKVKKVDQGVSRAVMRTFSLALLVTAFVGCPSSTPECRFTINVSDENSDVPTVTLTCECEEAEPSIMLGVGYCEGNCSKGSHCPSSLCKKYGLTNDKTSLSETCQQGLTMEHTCKNKKCIDY